MKISTAILLVLVSYSECVRAEIIPLYCRDFIVLTENVVQQRDAKFPKRKSLEYLGGDEFMNNRDKKIVRIMIERVFQESNEGLAYHLEKTRKECAIKGLRN